MRVWNKNKEKPPKDAVFVGRPSKWGNPFKARYESQREWAIKQFREWVLSKPELVEAIKKELRGKDLVCYCKPKNCHADVLFEIANE